MSEQDPRKLFIISQIRIFFHLKEMPQELLVDPYIEDFLNTTTTNAIRAQKDPSNNQIVISSISAGD